MSYQIRYEPHGAIKYFAGRVSAHDLLQSERDIMGHPRFTEFRYIISVYLSAEATSFTEDDRQELRALRIGSYRTNPRVRYAAVTQDARIRQNIMDSVEAGEVLHATSVFDNYLDAVMWANRTAQKSPPGSDGAST